jgi:hypothetical protein
MIEKNVFRMPTFQNMINRVIKYHLEEECIYYPEEEYRKFYDLEE